jgi:hypothetical protein
MAEGKDSIVLLTSEDPDNPGFGTGFVFRRDGSGRSFLLTCLHVVETLEKPRKSAAGEPPGVLAAGKPAEVWQRGDGILDLAVLAVDDLALAPLRLGRPVQRGATIRTAGFTEFEAKQKSVVPRTLEGAVRDNNPVLSRRSAGRPGAWSLDIAIAQETFRELTDGYSGAPVLDPASGTVVGIMNLKRSGTKGHALCVGSCELLFKMPGARPLPDDPADPSARQTAAAGGLGWLTSTLDHTDQLNQVIDGLDLGSGGPWFYAFQACRADYPQGLAEHLAVRLTETFGGVRPSAAPNDDLLTVLSPTHWDKQGVWSALVAKIRQDGAQGGGVSDAECLLHWVNDGPVTVPGGPRVVYCELTLTTSGGKAPDFITGAIQDFRTLLRQHPRARVLFLFACVFEPTGLQGLVARLRLARLARLEGCEHLGALTKVCAKDLTAWFQVLARPDLVGLDVDRLQSLHDTLDPLFKDATHLHYQRIRRPALDILAQATLAAPHPGDPA